MSLKKLRNLLVFDYEGFFEPTNEAGQKKKWSCKLQVLNLGQILKIRILF